MVFCSEIYLVHSIQKNFDKDCDNYLISRREGYIFVLSSLNLSKSKLTQ